MNIAESHVVEWSESTGSFRVRSFGEVQNSKVREFFGECVREYSPLGFFNSAADAVRFIEERVNRARS